MTAETGKGSRIDFDEKGELVGFPEGELSEDDMRAIERALSAPAVRLRYDPDRAPGMFPKPHEPRKDSEWRR